MKTAKTATTAKRGRQAKVQAVATITPRVTIRSKIFELFDATLKVKGNTLDNVDFTRAAALVMKVNPASAFNKAHLSWYKGKYKEERGI